MEKRMAKKPGKLLLVMVLLVALMPSNRIIATNPLSEATVRNQEKNQSGTSFSVRPILPSNQEREESTFFDLRMEPGQEQIIDIEVINHTGETIEIEVAVFTATTNRNGFAEYQLRPEVPDSTLPYLMEELITTTSYAEVPPEGSRWIPIQIQMPEEAYHGVLAGGIEIKRAAWEEEPSTGGIRNVYSFLTVILLHQGEAVSPQIVSGGTEIEFNGRKGVLTTNFQNTEAAFVNGLKIQTTIINRQTRAVVFESKIEGLQMAPHSNFCYQIQAQEEEFSEGIYILHYMLESGDASWAFKEHIRITGDGPLEGVVMSRGEVLLLEMGRGLKVFLGLALIVGLATVGLHGVKRKKKKDRNNA